jgi:hypothetical protein
MPRLVPAGRRVGVRRLRPSVQDRGFAHYLTAFDGGAYVKAFLDGKDQHWQGVVALGLVPQGTGRDKNSKAHTAIREGAKRFRYAFLYGCGSATAGRIIYDTVRAVHQIDNANDLQQRLFGGSVHPSTAALTQIGKQALDRFEVGTPGLRRLRESLKAHARKHGWLVGLDGRRVPVRALYSALNFIVTSSEAIICKRWLIQTYDELCARFRYGWGSDVVIVLWIHDELVCCCRPEIADEVGEIMVRHAKEPAEFYGFKVPLDAEYQIGRSWAGEPLGDAQEDDRRTNTEAETAASEVENSEGDGSNHTGETAGNDYDGGNGIVGNAGLIWVAPTSIEVPPDSAEFAAILASLSEEDRAAVRSAEAPRSNGHDRQNANQMHEQNRGDGYTHGERDTGRQVAFFVYRHADGQPYLGIKKTSSKQFPQYHWTVPGGPRARRRARRFPTGCPS